MRSLLKASVAAGILIGFGGTTAFAAESLADVIKWRSRSPKAVLAAAKTYTPTGKRDEFIVFSSGGQSGQVIVYGVPSMRILKQIAVFTPEPWQGFGYGERGTQEVLAQGGQTVYGEPLTWADTHHPALSETDGDYDGDWLFINDKANARVAVIDLRDFDVKQIVKNPITLSDHGGTFVTPDTDYIVEGGQYAMPLGFGYSSIENYEEDYRGMVTFWKFDRAAGRIDKSQSFAIELPPYWQDLCDSGKLVSEGWIFCNSINTEMATGMTHSGEQFEAGAGANETDFLHAINLEAATSEECDRLVAEVLGHFG